jgi:hypothetical protein
VFGHVANPFTTRTLDVGEKRPTVTVRVCDLAAAARGTSAAVAITNSAGLITNETTASTVCAVATAIAKAAATRVAATRRLITTNAVAGGDSLNARKVSIDAAHAGVSYIPESSLGILVDACREAVEAKVWWEVAILVFVLKRVDMG